MAPAEAEGRRVEELVQIQEEGRREKMRGAKSAFVPKWCFGVMAMWLAGLITTTKFASGYLSLKIILRRWLTPTLKGECVVLR